MKYFSLSQINESLKYLSSVHPFFLITFPAAKIFNLPVGKSASIALDAVTDQVLRRYYKLHPKSKYFFKPYKGANRNKAWVTPKYASTGLQAINTQTFRDAFIHPPASALWGWKDSYVTELKKHLPRRQRIQLLHLAVWFNRDTPNDDGASRADVVRKFIRDLSLSRDELNALFDRNFTSTLSEDEAFQQTPVGWEQIIASFPMPPDVGPEAEAILTFIALQTLGPVPYLECRPAARLNLITGDNGVGKTFLLDVIWWALTNEWAEFPILPTSDKTDAPSPSITFQFAGTIAHLPQTATYDVKAGWVVGGERTIVRSLVLYSRSDGAFAVWDPIRNESPASVGKITLNRDEVWFGKERQIEGLLRDLVSWSSLKDRRIIDLFLRTLARLAPPEMPHFELGQPRRLPGFSQPMPQLRHPYGDVPLLFESAGIKRMVALAYLIVWSWTEHRMLAESSGLPTVSQLVLLVDELEAHLHPKWQRTVLPALLGVLSDLSADLDSQIFVATHSPLVAASMESDFRYEVDRFFNLDLQKDGTASFSELEYRPRGPVDDWLTSPAFGLHEARSLGPAAAIRAAVELQEQDKPDSTRVAAVHAELVRLLPATDRFWARWLLFAKRNGVEL